MLLEGNNGTEQTLSRRKLLATMSLAGAAALITGVSTGDTMGRDVSVLETVYGGQDPGTWIGKTKCTPVNIWDYAGKEVAMFSYLSSLYYAWPEEMKAIDWDIVSMPSFKDLPKVGSGPR
jgi:hypothetical protein